jgi:nucleoside-triphosphatase
MKILLTGAKRVGKTTLLRELISTLKPDFWVLSDELRNPAGERSGFAAETSIGQGGQFAWKFSDHPGVIMGNYQVDIEAIDRYFTDPIKAAFKPGALLVIDEIGRMEMLSPRFQALTKEIFNQPLNLIATIPLPGDWTKIYDSYVEDFTTHPEVTTLTLTTGNQPQIRRQIIQAFK